MIPADWTVHRRDDGELLGWIRPERDAWLAIDLLGREITGGIEWLDAEAALEQRGLAWLAEPWTLETDAGAVRVRLVETTPERIVVKVDDFGDVGRATPRFVLPWPAPAALRPVRDDDPDAFAL